MYRYKKLMVGLNLEETDALLIQYAGFISKMAESTEIHFVHVHDSFDIPDEIKKIYPEIVTPADDAAKLRMKAIVEKHFSGHPGAMLKYDVIEGSMLGTFLSLSKANDHDLLIVGHAGNKQSAVPHFSEKLARKSSCSVLILPADARVTLDTILASVDFSEHALNTLDVGSAFAKAAGLDSIHILNTCKVPEGYYKTGKSYEKFSEIMVNNAKTKLSEIIARADLKGLRINPVFKVAENTMEGIQQVSDQIDASLIVVGARGRSGEISAILLGSVTEGLIRSLRRPLLAVKEKGEGLNILESLLA